MNNGKTAYGEHTKSISEVIADLKVELQEFVGTRVAMLRSELREKLRSFALTAPVLVVGLVMLWTAWLLFTGLLVALIAAAFTPNPWAYVVALAIVAVGYLIIGGFAATSAWKRMKEQSLTPRRTIRVLQQDGIWIRRESEAQL